MSTSNPPSSTVASAGSTSAAGDAESVEPDELDAGYAEPDQDLVHERSIYGPVLFPAATLVVLFVAVATIVPEWFGAQLDTINKLVVDGVGWYYVLLVVAFVAFSLWMGLSRYGDVRLGEDDAEPEYGLMSWFAMLFAAGMGIGLVFWGAAEPLNHLATPPPGSPTMDQNTAAAARNAMAVTFLHWGLHPWAIYTVVGLSIAYAVHRRGRPVSIRWALEPLLGERVKGWVGDVVDVVAVVGTLFGVATSLGFGVVQLSAGLEILGLAEASITLLLLLVGGITVLALISVVSGLDVGIKWLSNGNLVLAGILMVALLALGPTLFILREFVQNLGQYLIQFIPLSFRTLAFEGGAGADWLGSWTTYYWGWWISWSPFVGIFIARISRGRTVREFVLGVLLAPTLMTFLWFSVLGGSAIYRELFGGGGLIAADGTVSTEAALFQLLEGMPGASVLTGLFLLLIVVFFVTSSDSGSFVVSMLSAGGDPQPHVGIRVLWGVLSGAIAGVLLWVGSTSGALTSGLAALQTMAILVAAPFTIVMIAMCVSVFRALNAEHRLTLRLERAALRRELTRELSESGALEPSDC